MRFRDRPAGTPRRSDALLFFRVCFLLEVFFFSTLFGTGFFFANFFPRFTVFDGVGFLRAVFFDLVELFLAFFLVAIREV